MLQNKIILSYLKMPIQEFHFDKVLEDLEFTKDQFIDLCILLGCDYCESIKGVGPVKAIKLIQEHKCIEEAIKHLDASKYPIPEGWLYKEARELFKNPDVTPADKCELKWREPQVKLNYDQIIISCFFLLRHVRLNWHTAKFLRLHTTADPTECVGFHSWTFVLVLVHNTATDQTSLEAKKIRTLGD